MLWHFTPEGLLATSTYCARELAIVAAAAFAWRLLRLRSGARRRGRLLGRAQIGTNLLYTFTNAMITSPLFYGFMVWATTDFQAFYWRDGRELIGGWSYAVQFLAATYITDLVAYLRHRAFHSRYLWNVHAAHHSAPDLYFLVNGRTHPLNAFIGSITFTLVPYSMGFPLGVSVAAVLARKYWGYLIHSNMLHWDFGPLRHVLVSPLFHAWHHSVEDAALDKNFSGLFAFHDWIFGTYYLPKDRLPRDFGVQDPVYPSGFLRQLAYPFLRLPRASRHSAQPAAPPLSREAPAELGSLSK